MLLVGGVVAVGLTCTAVLVTVVDQQRQAHLAQVMDERALVIENAVTSEVQRYVDTSTDLAASIGAQSDLSANDFTALTATLTRERFSGISGVSLVVPATDAQIAGVQREWRARGNRQLVLASTRTGTEHQFVVLNHPLDGTAAQSGRDLSQANEPAQALQAARTSGQAAASPTYVLLKDRQLPTAQQQLSFVLATPVYGGAGTPDAGQFRGWISMGLRGRDFLAETMRAAAQETVAVTLLDAGGLSGPARISAADNPPQTVPVASAGGAPILGQPQLDRRVAVQIAGRSWQLTLRPTKRFAATAGPSLGLATGIGGALCTVLLTVLVGSLSTSRNRALSQVDNATAALRADIERREVVEAALLRREQQLEAMALTDSLTGLANRRAFMEQLDRSHARALRHGSRIAVLFGDVNNFKTINDTYGHRAGDGVLCQVAARLRAQFRTEDTLGRLGGDEFAIICENVTPYLDGLVERVHTALAVPYDFDGKQILASVSIGMAAPKDGESSAQLLDRADQTMYRAKAESAAPRRQR